MRKDDDRGFVAPLFMTTIEGAIIVSIIIIAAVIGISYYVWGSGVLWLALSMILTVIGVLMVALGSQASILFVYSGFGMMLTGFVLFLVFGGV